MSDVFIHLPGICIQNRHPVGDLFGFVIRRVATYKQSAWQNTTRAAIPLTFPVGYIGEQRDLQRQIGLSPQNPGNSPTPIGGISAVSRDTTIWSHNIQVLDFAASCFRARSCRHPHQWVLRGAWIDRGGSMISTFGNNLLTGEQRTGSLINPRQRRLRECGHRYTSHRRTRPAREQVSPRASGRGAGCTHHAGFVPSSRRDHQASVYLHPGSRAGTPP